MMRTFKVFAVAACGLLVASTAWAQDDAVAELVKALKSPEAEARVEACRKLSQMGRGAEAAVPALAETLQARDDLEVSSAAALALGAIGGGAKEAVPALIEALKADDAKLRAYAAYALGEIGPAARDAAVPLLELITDQDASVRRQARDSIREIEAPQELILSHMARILQAATPSDAAVAVQTLAELGEVAVPGLCEALKDDDACYWAILALAEIGEKAQAAVPGLGKLLTHKDPEVRMQALIALGEIGPASKPLARQIGNMLDNDEEAGVRYAAAFALGMIGDAAAARESVSKALDSDDPFLRVTAAWALLRLSQGRTPLLRKAVKNVLDALESDNADVRVAAARALADPAVPQELMLQAFRAAMQGLQESHPEKIMPIVDALATLGKKVVPACIRSLEEKRPMRFFALQILIRVGPEAAEAVPAITATLEDPDANLRREALYALGAVGAEAARATEAIVARLADEDLEVRAAACYALGKIGPGARAALPALAKVMDSEDEFLKIASVWASLKISPDDSQMRQKAVPLLTRALSDVREHVRVESAYTLGELGEVAKSAVQALEKARNDPSYAVRQAATQALEQLK